MPKLDYIAFYGSRGVLRTVSLIAGFFNLVFILVGQFYHLSYYADGGMYHWGSPNWFQLFGYTVFMLYTFQLIWVGLLLLDVLIDSDDSDVRRADGGVNGLVGSAILLISVWWGVFLVASSIKTFENLSYCHPTRGCHEGNMFMFAILSWVCVVIQGLFSTVLGVLVFKAIPYDESRNVSIAVTRQASRNVPIRPSVAPSVSTKIEDQPPTED